MGMREYKMRGPDGLTFKVMGPDDATDEELEQAAAQLWKPTRGASAARGVVEPPMVAPQPQAPSAPPVREASPASAQPPSDPNALWKSPSSLDEYTAALGDAYRNSTLGGVVRGFRDVVDTGADWLTRGVDKVAGTNINPGIVAGNKAARDQWDSEEGTFASGAGRLSGNIMAVNPALKLVGAGLTRVGLPGLGKAVETSGATTGTPRLQGALGVVSDLTKRTVAGTAAGGASATLVDPEQTVPGAVVGGVTPSVLAGSGALGRVVGGFLKPFFSRGQDTVIADYLRELLPDVNATAGRVAAMRASPALPGVPQHAAAADAGLAGLNRTLQSSHPPYATELSDFLTRQNQARNDAIENVAHDPSVVELMKSVRSTATDPMRDSVLRSARPIDPDPLRLYADIMKKNPENAGELSQKAIEKFRNKVTNIVSPDTGTIDARALYEVRKDLNRYMRGELAGDDGNLKFARQQLKEIKDAIDDTIEMASKKPGSAATPWRDYLQTYAKESVPINQVEKLQELWKAIQNSSTDTTAKTMTLSPAKMNNYMKAHGKELEKLLSPDQMQIVRGLQQDLNDSALALTGGKAFGSNTMQNLSQDAFMKRIFGDRIAVTAPVRTTIGTVMSVPYRWANRQIMDKMGHALMDPTETERLLRLAAARGSRQPGAITGPLGVVASRAMPLLTNDQ